ncbi:MAG TPA: peptidylprolyl isomerase [Terriglobales bacterium]|nr:peptidylprolyl isomerase [Terriglobales bacterium]
MFRMLVVCLLLSFSVSAQTNSNSSPAGTQKPGGRKHSAANKSTASKSAADVEPMPTVDKPTAIIDTTAGRMSCTLFPDKSPKSVENFVGLATGMKDWKDLKTKKMMHHVPLYNGTIFHRVIQNFMIQGGDPLGDGTGGPGYEISDEFPNVKFDAPGRLAYANSGPNTDGSQFFITEAATPWLDTSGHYTIFGTCDEATVALVKNIARRARDERTDRPFDPVKIEKITILGMSAASAPPVKAITRKKPSAAK